jgi:hypothetical protein
MQFRDPQPALAVACVRRTLAACTAACPLALACLAAPARAEDYAFKVFCNGSPVGYHEVHVRHDADETDVDIDAHIDVTFAGIEIYRYRHRSHEIWRDGKLEALRSETNDDGEAMSVSVHPGEDGMLVVESNQGRREVPPDILPTSLWNPEVLGQRQLLDTESGRTLKVRVAQLSDGRYQMSGDLSLQVDYRSGHWDGLHFRYFGSDVDFRPESRTEAVLEAQ